MSLKIDRDRTAKELGDFYVSRLKMLKYFRPPKNLKGDWIKIRQLPKHPKKAVQERLRMDEEALFCDLMYHFIAIITAPTAHQRAMVIEYLWERWREGIALEKAAQGLIVNMYGFEEQGFDAASVDYMNFETIMLKMMDSVEKQLVKMSK